MFGIFFIAVPQVATEVIDKTTKNQQLIIFLNRNTWYTAVSGNKEHWETVFDNASYASLAASSVQWFFASFIAWNFYK